MSDLRANLQDVIDSIFYTEEPVVVARRNKPRVIISPLPKDDKKVEMAISEYQKSFSETKSKIDK